MADIYLPKNRTHPYKEIIGSDGRPTIVMNNQDHLEVPPLFEGDHATLIFGGADGHQADEILHKIQEDAEQNFKLQRRILPPKRITITTLKNKAKQLVGYILEIKGDDGNDPRILRKYW